ncbi:glycosyltransferase family 2 protein [Psychromonas ossibalaenae]|uniref:glycosyltransferase family 2 protein n=1 Tax=Psychromonas ossibalaenae TaxID=444922 RepID=UPI00037CCE84|nr:glycosyltransferase family 2 protein [Psychromonas ossibalaenae]
MLTLDNIENKLNSKKVSTTKMLISREPIIINQASDKYQTHLFIPPNIDRLSEGGRRFKGDFKHSNKITPLISIVTIVYNGELHLEETIQSVLTQNYDNVEYIIIDGGSSDSSLEIINKYNDQIDYWISEKDFGISDAFNKGIRCCTGELIGLINADDYYEEGAFEVVAEKYQSQSDPLSKIFFGKTYKITMQGIKREKRDTKLGWCLSVPFSHCSSFVTRSYYQKYGLFDLDYKIAMDVDLLMRGVKKEKYVELSSFIATQRDGGISDINRTNGYKEYFRVSKKYYGVVLSFSAYLVKMLIFTKNKVCK